VRAGAAELLRRFVRYDLLEQTAPDTYAKVANERPLSTVPGHSAKWREMTTSRTIFPYPSAC
jgi:hypothetical protein